MVQVKAFILVALAIAVTALFSACTENKAGPATTIPATASRPATPTRPASRPATRPAARVRADIPAPRTLRGGQPDAAWLKQHEANVALAQKGNIDLYFTGDASIERWSSTGKQVWSKEFGAWHPANFAIPGEKTQNLLWRLQNGELDGVKPKAFVLLIGANNQPQNTPEQTAAGVTAIVHQLQVTNPQAKVLLMGILPRKGPQSPARKNNAAANVLLAKLEDGNKVKFLDIGPQFLNADSTLREDLVDNEQTYLTEKGYQVFAEAIKPILAKWLGGPTLTGGQGFSRSAK